MSSIAISYYASPVGELKIGTWQNTLCLCDWRYRRMRQAIDNRVCQHLQASMVEEETSTAQEAISQLQAYFDGQLTSFSLPLTLAGTAFQQRVWQALQQVPYGHTCSYLQLSAQLGDPLAIRAVASANGANAISIIVPCHRIVGSQGELTGYAGGLPAKAALLALEKRVLHPDRVAPAQGSFGF